MECSRCDGMILFDDQICELIDFLISQDCVRLTYINRRNRSWIRFVSDENLRDGLLQLTEMQIRIIEAVAFDGVSAMNLKYELGLSVREIRMEVREMRKTLLKAM